MTYNNSGWGGKSIYRVYVPGASLTIPVLPRFNAWNKGTTRLFANCHAFFYDAMPPDMADMPAGQYVLNMPSPGFVGVNAGKTLAHPSLVAAIIADGCIKIAKNTQPPPAAEEGFYLGAVFLERTIQYHFVRRDEESGIWYHKPDWDLLVTNLDGRSQIIHDPQTANLGFFTNFQGYVWVPGKGIPLEVEIIPPRATSPSRVIYRQAVNLG